MSPSGNRFIPTPVGNTRSTRTLGLVGRFIPTPVGNTPQVHPHACGAWHHYPVHPPVGSPHGDTLRSAVDKSTVHPHACGEHEIWHSRTSNRGSSPRLWGTRGCGMPVHPHACGEHVKHQTRVMMRHAVHPHACGEHAFTACIIRFIPTPVGNTDQRENVKAVHPHACGEHVFYGKDGSSPRLWGTRTAKFSHMHHHRFIPTPVGNMLTISIMEDRFIPTPVGNTERGVPRCMTVHPHACGEHGSIMPSVHPHACGEHNAFSRS